MMHFKRSLSICLFPSSSSVHTYTVFLLWPSSLFFIFFFVSGVLWNSVSGAAVCSNQSLFCSSLELQKLFHVKTVHIISINLMRSLEISSFHFMVLCCLAHTHTPVAHRSHRSLDCLRIHNLHSTYQTRAWVRPDLLQSNEDVEWRNMQRDKFIFTQDETDKRW